ncbi:hypothetical protein CVT26_008960 [Gymnopilus dilepis]|uniref:Uncharacterized protein n=1 Tax=Gymnopilus dilepis TaxID=231916 RepID=A0A409YRW4_9AGAR|nr:hypothetical protein CVT26_008960 [Gymnopilus dilepis]
MEKERSTRVDAFGVEGQLMGGPANAETGSTSLIPLSLLPSTTLFLLLPPPSRFSHLPPTRIFARTFALAPPPPPSPCKSKTGADISPSFEQPHPHLPRVQEGAGGGLLRLFNPAQGHRRRHRCLAASPSLEKTSRSCGEHNGRSPPRSAASAQCPLPRIEERVADSSSIGWLLAVVITAVAAAHPSSLVTRSRRSGLPAGGYTQLRLAPSSFPTPSTPPRRHPLAIREFWIDACGTAVMADTPATLICRTESGVGVLAGAFA